MLYLDNSDFELKDPSNEYWFGSLSGIFNTHVPDRILEKYYSIMRYNAIDIPSSPEDLIDIMTRVANEEKITKSELDLIKTLLFTKQFYTFYLYNIAGGKSGSGIEVHTYFDKAPAKIQNGLDNIIEIGRELIGKATRNIVMQLLNSEEVGTEVEFEGKVYKLEYDGSKYTVLLKKESETGNQSIWLKIPKMEHGDKDRRYLYKNNKLIHREFCSISEFGDLIYSPSMITHLPTDQSFNAFYDVNHNTHKKYIDRGKMVELLDSNKNFVGVALFRKVGGGEIRRIMLMRPDGSVRNIITEDLDIDRLHKIRNRKATPNKGDSYISRIEYTEHTQRILIYTSQAFFIFEHDIGDDEQRLAFNEAIKQGSEEEGLTYELKDIACEDIKI